VAPKALATYNAFVEGAAITDSQPCIDGAYIYPAPDYQDTGDGFMRCTVTAYGRWKDSGTFQTRKSLIEGRISLRISQPTQSGYQTSVIVKGIDGFVDTLTQTIVVPKLSIPNVNSFPSSFGFYDKVTGVNHLQVNYTPQYFFPLVFSEGTWQGNFTPRKLKLDPLVVDRIDSVNYGNFDEYTITWSPLIRAATSSNYISLIFEDAELFTRDQYLPPAAPIIEILTPFQDYFEIKITPGAYTNNFVVSVKEGEAFISASISSNRTPLVVWNERQINGTRVFLFGGDIRVGATFQVIVKATNTFGSTEGSLTFTQQAL